MQVAYVYDIKLPTRYTAVIQILHTCHQLASQDVPVTVYIRKLSGFMESALADYGLQPHPLLRIHPLHGTLAYRLSPVWALGKLIRDASDGNSLMIVSRGEPGIELYPHLRAHLTRHPHVRWIYEAHRLCGSESDQKQPGEGHLRLPLSDVRKLEKSAVRNAAGLICLTPAVETALRDLYPVTAPVLILPSGAPTPSAEPGSDADRDIDILYAGKLERRKGILDLIRAMQFLPQHRAVVAGGSAAEVAETREEAEKFGVARQVEFLGFVEPSGTEALYRRARVGVCPLPAGQSLVSEQFTSPLKLLHMMASRTPVVATAVPSVERIVRHGESALLVPPGDAQAMAEAIRSLLEDRQLAARLTRAAEAVVRQYSWENRARQMKEFLLRLRPA